MHRLLGFPGKIKVNFLFFHFFLFFPYFSSFFIIFSPFLSFSYTNPPFSYFWFIFSPLLLFVPFLCAPTFFFAQFFVVNLSCRPLAMASRYPSFARSAAVCVSCYMSVIASRISQGNKFHRILCITFDASASAL